MKCCYFVQSTFKFFWFCTHIGIYLLICLLRFLNQRHQTDFLRPSSPVDTCLLVA